MRTLVESLKRLYKAGRITIEYIRSLVLKNTITVEEYKEITGEYYG